MATLVIRKRGGAFVLDTAKHSASLRTGFTMRRGEIRTPAGLWTVTSFDRGRIGVVCSTRSGPVIRLHPRRADLPGLGGPARWTAGHRGGKLTRDGNRLSVTVPALSSREIKIDLGGTWAEPDLVMMTAVFAVLTRRRHRALMIVAIAGATGHGPAG